MKARFTWALYILAIGLFAAIAFHVLEAGKQLELPIGALPGAYGSHLIEQNLLNLARLPIAVFIMQLVVVIVTTRACGYLLKKVGQPAVVGEVIAGIILGPSVLFQLAPGVGAFLFPAASIGYLHVFSQIGLIFFMFVLGLEVDLAMLSKRAGSAIVISHASIIFPLVLGICLSYFLYGYFALPHTKFSSFALFMGTALSITAFPVLGRILKEKDLLNTRLGNMALTCAAIDDITAWCLLALLLAVAKGGTGEMVLYMVLLILAYIVVMFVAVRPLVKLLLQKVCRGKDQYTLVVTCVVVLLSAWCAEVMGIHVLFGAFIAGLIMPKDQGLQGRLIVGVGDALFIVMLPLFFACTGLRTRIGSLDSLFYWMIFGLTTVVAVAGKLGGSAIAARCTGESTGDSLSIGVLMNTRGLVELVVLNLGLEMGILSDTLFTIMILVALFTTMMTTPLLALLQRRRFS